MHSPPTPKISADNLLCDYSHTQTECPAILTMTKTVTAILDAFPAGGYAGLRLYHEELIATMKARREFWQKLTFELAKFGLVGFIGRAFYKITRSIPKCCGYHH